MLRTRWRARLNIPFIAAGHFLPSRRKCLACCAEFLHTNAVYPHVVDGELAVAMARPQDAFVLKALRLSTGLTVGPTWR